MHFSLMDIFCQHYKILWYWFLVSINVVKISAIIVVAVSLQMIFLSSCLWNLFVRGFYSFSVLCIDVDLFLFVLVSISNSPLTCIFQVFHPFWKIFNHYFFKYCFLLFSLCSLSLPYTCLWWTLDILTLFSISLKLSFKFSILPVYGIFHAISSYLFSSLLI